MESTTGPVCTACPNGYYQEHRGQTVCVKCRQYTYRIGGLATSAANCIDCNPANKDGVNAYWLDKVYETSACEWDCTPPYVKREVNRRQTCVLPANAPSTAAATQTQGATTAPSAPHTTPNPNSPNSPNSPNGPNTPNSPNSPDSPATQNTSQTTPSTPSTNIGLIVGLIIGGMMLFAVVLCALLYCANDNA